MANTQQPPPNQDSNTAAGKKKARQTTPIQPAIQSEDSESDSTPIQVAHGKGRKKRQPKIPSPVPEEETTESSETESSVLVDTIENEDDRKAIAFSKNSQSKLIEDAIKNHGKYDYFRVNEQRKSGGTLFNVYKSRLAGQSENTLIFSDGKIFRKSQFSIKLNPKYQAPKPKPKTKNPPGSNPQVKFGSDFNFTEFYDKNTAPQRFPDPATFKTPSEQRRKKASKQPLMNEVDYPASSFTFVQPSPHKNIVQDSSPSPQRSAIPPISTIFDPPTVQSEDAGQNVQPSQPAIEQSTNTGKSLSPKKQWLNRAEASGMIDEDNMSPELTDPRSLSNVLEGQTASTSQIPATSSTSEESDQSDSSSGRPRRERKIPDRYGKYFVHVVEGHNLEVEGADIDKSNAQAANDIPKSHIAKKSKRQNKEGGEERPSKKHKKNKKADSD